MGLNFWTCNNPTCRKRNHLAEVRCRWCKAPRFLDTDSENINGKVI